MKMREAAEKANRVYGVQRAAVCSKADIEKKRHTCRVVRVRSKAQAHWRRRPDTHTQTINVFKARQKRKRRNNETKERNEVHKSFSLIYRKKKKRFCVCVLKLFNLDSCACVFSDKEKKKKTAWIPATLLVCLLIRLTTTISYDALPETRAGLDLAGTNFYPKKEAKLETASAEKTSKRRARNFWWTALYLVA